MSDYTEIKSSCGNTYRVRQIGFRNFARYWIGPGLRNADGKVYACYEPHDDLVVGYIATVNGVAGPMCRTGGASDLGFILPHFARQAKENAVTRAMHVYMARVKTK